MEDNRIKKPLQKTIYIGSTIFILVLCLCIGLIVYFSYKNFFFNQSQKQIKEIITYVTGHIDNDDLKNCMETGVESTEYKRMMVLLDDVKEDFNPQYLYIIKPLKENGGNHVQILVSAENYYDRYVDTEGNLYLGDVTEDEYTKEEVDDYHRIMKESEIVFMESKTFWGHSYCGFYTLRDSTGAPFAILGVDLDMTQISKDILYKTINVLIVVIGICLLFFALFISWTTRSITKPIKMLENSAIDYIEKSKSGQSISELNFNKPELDIKNEVEALSNTVNQMTEDIKEYMLKVISAEEEALFMKKIANTDSLTGARNKLSYDEKLKEINTKISKNLIDNFGIIMLDVNYLKKINDTYGHKYGDLLIKNFCTIVCDIFVHSPVYRIGGDEFVVILQKRDLQNADNLIAKFEKVMEEYASDSNLQPWEAPSVAFGISYYDKTTDTKAEDVFKRADEAMYQKKKEMKALRTD